MIKQWLEEYQPKNQAEANQALREIMQEIALYWSNVYGIQ